eukprot:Platyproteum_vivax@DN4438_c0_g1_i2.p1
MVNPHLRKLFAEDIVLLKQLNIHPVVVHGGGPQIKELLGRLNITSSFVEGLRITNDATVEVAEMVLSGVVNKALVASINAAGGRAIGISGRDDKLIVAERAMKLVQTEEGEEQLVSLGHVGKPKQVNAKIIEDLIAAGLVPVIAPIGCGV